MCSGVGYEAAARLALAGGAQEGVRHNHSQLSPLQYPATIRVALPTTQAVVTGESLVENDLASLVNLHDPTYACIFLHVLALLPH